MKQNSIFSYVKRNNNNSEGMDGNEQCSSYPKRNLIRTLAYGKTPTTVTWSENVKIPAMLLLRNKFNSRTISTQVSQLVSADRQSSGHEWIANPSLHNTRTV